MSASSGFGPSSARRVRGSKAMPHLGHAAGRSLTTSGSIGQIYSTLVPCRRAAMVPPCRRGCREGSGVDRSQTCGARGVAEISRCDPRTLTSRRQWQGPRTCHKPDRLLHDWEPAPSPTTRPSRGRIHEATPVNKRQRNASRRRSHSRSVTNRGSCSLWPAVRRRPRPRAAAAGR